MQFRLLSYLVVQEVLLHERQRTVNRAHNIHFPRNSAQRHIIVDSSLVGSSLARPLFALIMIFPDCNPQKMHRISPYIN